MFTPSSPPPASLPQILIYGQPGLRQISQTIPSDFPVDDDKANNRAGLRTIIQSMVDVLHNVITSTEGGGGGLAAPQVNLSLSLTPPINRPPASLLLRLFILPPLNGSTSYREFINPVIVDASFGENQNCPDGCLSIPEAPSGDKCTGTATVAPSSIPRPESVTIEYSTIEDFANPTPTRTTQKFAYNDEFGETWFLVQHEIDHLNGKLFCDYFQPGQFSANLYNIAANNCFQQPEYPTYPQSVMKNNGNSEQKA